MIAKKSREESKGAGSGVEILVNEPYEDGPGGCGQYTHKIYHVGSHLPGWFKALLPKSALTVEEEAWNAYPYTKTRYTCPFIERFYLEIETKYFGDAGEQENVFELAGPELRNRQVGVLNKENFGDNSTPWLLVIPIDLREEIFQACHDDPTSGHLGYSRTLARIREKYYWPKLPKVVHLYTPLFHECQRCKKPQTKPAGLLQPIAPPTAPFQQIGMDLLGTLSAVNVGKPLGNRRHRLSHAVYAETTALPSGTAVEVARFFIESIVLRHGAPEFLITDRGSSFMAQLTQEIVRLSHTSHRRTTAYHPQTNGLTERLNKTIADMISMYVDVEHKTWDEVLPYVTFAYNTAVQEATGVTPFQLVHGREVTTMLDAMLPHEPSDNESDDAQAVAQRAEEVRQLARLMIQDQQLVVQNYR
ncbi:DDE-type integrase/transposase/recombinase [Ixodes scapularis]